MTTKAVINGRVAYSNGRIPKSDSVAAGEAFPFRVEQVSPIKTKKVAVDTNPIPGDHPHSPFREGTAMRDEDGVIYRVVRELKPEDGWGTAEFWTKRWGISSPNDPQAAWKFMRDWIARGWLDAAMQAGSPTKRYRCRDERRIYRRLWELHNESHNGISKGDKTRLRYALLRLKPLFEPEGAP